MVRGVERGKGRREREEAGGEEGGEGEKGVTCVC